MLAAKGNQDFSALNVPSYYASSALLHMKTSKNLYYQCVAKGFILYTCIRFLMEWHFVVDKNSVTLVQEPSVIS
jgi:hypothetical protein